jgi:hypothetical protein
MVKFFGYALALVSTLAAGIAAADFGMLIAAGAPAFQTNVSVAGMVIGFVCAMLGVVAAEMQR